MTDTNFTPNIYRIFDLQPINKGELIGITREQAVSETQGVWTVGLAVTPTITASTRYQIGFGNNGTKTQAGNSTFLPSYGWTSPSVLTSAATDRHNVYTALARQINASSVSYATAYPVVSIAHAAGAFVVGEVLTGATSGATGIILADAANVATVAMTSLGTDYENGENLDDETGSGPFAATAAPTLGLYMRILDDAGYYTPNTSRVGPNGCVAQRGFTDAMVNNATPGVVSRGQGAFLLADKPVQELLSSNLRSGTWEMATDNNAVAGQAYSKYTIVDVPKRGDGSLGQNFTPPQRIQVLYLYEGEADFAATSAALLGLT